ncbi:hypothetical protein Tco_1219403 [Tanacetum coccineum]
MKQFTPKWKNSQRPTFREKSSIKHGCQTQSLRADGRWKLCIDFTDINKTCPKENHLQPVNESKVEDIHKHQFKCFLDAYKGYHQILIAEKDEERWLSTQGKGCKVGQNMQVNDDEMVIKGDSKEEMLANIKETLKSL